MPDRCTDPTCVEHWPVEVALTRISPDAFELPPDGPSVWETIQREIDEVAIDE